MLLPLCSLDHSSQCPLSFENAESLAKDQDNQLWSRIAADSGICTVVLIHKSGSIQSQRDEQENSRDPQ